MFRQILLTQWRWSAPFVTLLGAFCIAVPLAAFNGLPEAPGAIIFRSVTWGFLYPALAALTGVLLGIAAWAADHRGQHVYAMTLPLPRWLYVVLRYGAGAVLIFALTIVVLAGAWLATATAVLPPGLHSYHGTVALRYAIGAMLSFSVIFAIAAGTSRTAGWILGGLTALVVAEFLASQLGTDFRILEPLAVFLVGSTGPFGMFSMPWLLVGI
jgi:hypothetical protein